MVDGYEIERCRVAVVDLDGTLVAGNTLHIFARCALRDAFRRHRIGDALAIAGLAGMRMLRLCTHRTMKFGILRHSAITDSLRIDFVARVESSRRRSVAAELKRLEAEGCRLLLATAAADVYVPWIWNGDYLATPVAGNDGHRELRGPAKLAAVQRWCSEQNADIYAVITDHADDLPLLASNEPVKILVDPSPSTFAAVALAGVDITKTLQ